MGAVPTFAVDCQRRSGLPTMMNNRRVTKSLERLLLSSFRLMVGVLLLVCAACVFRTDAQVTKSTETSGGGQQIRNTSPAPAELEDYIIGADDLLNLYVLDVPELSRDYRVSPSGTVTLPVMAKPLQAAGLTLSQFSERVSGELKAQGLVSEPHVTVSVNKSTLHSIAITGAVKRPQIYPVFSVTTLLDVLSEAEGLSEDAGNIAIVSRGDIGKRASRLGDATRGPDQDHTVDSLTIDLKRLLESGDPTINVRIYPGDRITVPRCGIVYVVGAVNKPGGFTMKDSSHGMTVLQAVALAADTKNTASRSQAVILRSDPQAPDGREQIPVDLKRIERGKSADPVLQAEDIVFVPDSSAKKAVNVGVASIVQMAVGMAIFK